MEDKDVEKKFLQSTVYTDFGNFFVSTIYRRSSAFDGGWFYETFAWKLDVEGKREKSIVADNSGGTFGRKAINQHMEVVHQLYETGKFELSA